MSEAILTGVEVAVGQLPDRNCVLTMTYDKRKPIVREFEEFREVAKQAAVVAFRAGLDAIDLVFHSASGDVHFNLDVPNTDKGEHLPPTTVFLERTVERKGFEVKYVCNKTWVVHRPDPIGSYSSRGYIKVDRLLAFAAVDSSSESIDRFIEEFSTKRTSLGGMAAYRSLTRGDSMATKKAAAKEAASTKVTVKGPNGDVSLSPKQAEVWEQIKSRSASGKPLGSDEERLSDPDSIAAMKLATEVGPLAHRVKIGTRWHYFASKGDMDKAVKANEKAAEEAAAIKAASKRPSKQAAEKKADKAPAGKKKSGPLKKPSEK